MKKISKTLDIPDNIKKNLQKVHTALREKNFHCYLVGGSVRDLVRGKGTHDYDIATDAHPDVVMKIFKKVVPTGIKHGTVTVLMGGNSFEVTTFRADGKYLDGRRPEQVSFSASLEEDITRRDMGFRSRKRREGAPSI